MNQWRNEHSFRDELSHHLVFTKNDEEPFFFPVAVDPNHLSPQEAAWKSRLTFGGGVSTRMSRHFDERKMPMLIPPRSTVEGFVYTNLD